MNYSAREMFDLVDDVDAYPAFLPWCRSSEVLSRNEDLVEASIEVAKGAVQKKFTTRNRLQQGKMIEMGLVEGPFKRLEGYWRFEVLSEQACKVSLDLDFEFSNRLMSMAFGTVFSQIANTLVDAFCKRAVDVYGKR